MQVLSRRTKNNPMLIGRPVLEKQQSQRALPKNYSRDIPDSLKNKQILALDMEALSQEPNTEANLKSD